MHAVKQINYMYMRKVIRIFERRFKILHIARIKNRMGLHKRKGPIVNLSSCHNIDTVNGDRVLDGTT